MAPLRRLTVNRVEPLLTHLIASLDAKRKDIKNLLKFGAVSVNGVSVRQFDHLLAIGDEVVVGDLRTAFAEGDLNRARIHVVYEDNAIVVAEKPAGMLTVATDNEKADTLYSRLNQAMQRGGRDGSATAFVVHRLDRETSGLVLFAKSEPVRRQLQDEWAAVEKTYQAGVVGVPEAEQGTIATYLTETTALQVFSNDHQTAGSRLARTHYRLLRTCGPLSLLEVRLDTGRKHQIRVHLAGLGCPVIGDRRYGEKSAQCDRLALHATTIALVHPLTGEPVRFESRLPVAIRKLFPRSTDRRSHEFEAL